MQITENGFALLNALILSPVFLAVLTLLYYVGHTGNEQSRAQRLCEQAVLNSAEEQAKGIARLSKLNSTAFTLAETREKLELMLVASSVSPKTAVVIYKMLNTIKGIQRTLGATQKAIEVHAVRKASAIQSKILSQFKTGKLISISPHLALGPHDLPFSMRLHTRKVARYARMDGAPLELDSDFNLRQRVSARLLLNPRTFIHIIQHPAPEAFSINCEARVTMKGLSEKWEAKLIKEDKPLWNFPSAPSSLL